MGLFKPNIRRMHKKIDVQGLIDALEHSDIKIRMDAIGALGEIGDNQAVESLIKLLDSDEKYISATAIHALEKIGDRRAVKPLIAMLKSPSVLCRQAAASALGKLGNLQTIQPLVELLDDDNDLYVWKEVADALDRLGWQPGADRIGMKFWIGKRQWKECIRIGVVAIEPLLEVINNHPENKEFFNGAANALGKIGDDRAVEPLIKLLDDYSCRWAAFTALAEIGDLRAVKPMSRYAASAPKEVYIKFGIHAVEPLIEELRSNQYRPDISNFAEILGEIGDLRAVEPLIKTLKEIRDNLQKYYTHMDYYSEKNRTAVVRALVKLSDSRAIKPVSEEVLAQVQIVHSSNEYIVGCAVSSLKSLLLDTVNFITPDALRNVASLDDPTGTSFIPDYNTYEVKEENWTIDCTEIRRLAEHELIRRGLNST